MKEISMTWNVSPVAFFLVPKAFTTVNSILLFRSLAALIARSLRCAQASLAVAQLSSFPTPDTFPMAGSNSQDSFIQTCRHPIIRFPGIQSSNKLQASSRVRFHCCIPEELIGHAEELVEVEVEEEVAQGVSHCGMMLAENERVATCFHARAFLHIQGVQAKAKAKAKGRRMRMFVCVICVGECVCVCL